MSASSSRSSSFSPSPYPPPLGPNLANLSPSSPEISATLELALDGKILYLSKLWESFVDISVGEILDKNVSQIIAGNDDDKAVFSKALGKMLQEDISYTVTFYVENWLNLENLRNPALTSLLLDIPYKTRSLSSDLLAEPMISSSSSLFSTNTQIDETWQLSDKQPTLLEAQGILIKDSPSNTPSRSIWLVRPHVSTDSPVTLPSHLALLLGSGTQLFLDYLRCPKQPDGTPLPPPQVLCNICECHVACWWLERHSELCYAESKAQSDVQMAEDSYAESLRQNSSGTSNAAIAAVSSARSAAFARLAATKRLHAQLRMEADSLVMQCVSRARESRDLATTPTVSLPLRRSRLLLLLETPHLPLLVSGLGAKPPSIRDYEMIKPISKGAFGSVYLARKKINGEYFAIKVLKKLDMIAKNQVTNVKAERAIMMSQSNSPYVAKLFCTFQLKNYLFLVMEYLNGGDCASLLKVLGTIPEEWAKRYVAEVIVGVEDLHKKGIVHRDLKPDNLLIDARGHVKLLDFGLLRRGLVRRQKNKGHEKYRDWDRGVSTSVKSLGAISSGSMASLNASPSPNLAHPSTPKSSPILRASSPILRASSPILKKNTKPLRESSLKREPSFGSDSEVNSPTTALFENLLKPTNLLPILRPLVPRSSSQTSFVLEEPPVPETPDMALFGSSKSAHFVGTPDYLAPETVSGNGQDQALDWWSLGCILFEFITGYPPFHAHTVDKVFENILKGSIDWLELEGVCSSSAKDLIQRLLCTNPEKRLGSQGAQEIKDHPFFWGIDWDKLWNQEALFIPMAENPENTEYFDSRGAQIDQSVADDSSDEGLVISNDKQLNLLFGGPWLPESEDTPSLLLSPVVRERRKSQLSSSSEFGLFQYRNLTALEKANKEVINRLKTAHIEHLGLSLDSAMGSRPRGLSLSSTGLPVPRPDDLSRQSSLGGASPVNTGYPSVSHSSLEPQSAKYLPVFSQSPTLKPLKSTLQRLDLPVSSDNEDTLLKVRKTRARKGERARILLCEPIPIFRYSGRKLLEKLGCRVDAVGSSDEIIQKVSGTTKYDAIITTIKWHRLNLTDVVRLIRNTTNVNSSTPIVALTAFVKEAEQLHCFDDIVEKPATLSNLNSLLNRLLGSRSS